MINISILNHKRAIDSKDQKNKRPAPARRAFYSSKFRPLVANATGDGGSAFKQAE